MSSPLVSPASQFASLPTGVELEYVEQGNTNGLPVVLLHGVTDSWRSFEGVLAHLPRSIRAFALSLRGHGNSTRPTAGYRFSDFSDDVRAFLDTRQIPAAVIVGHSMGSYVAQRFAIDHASRTLGLVLMGSFPRLRGNPAVRELWESVVSTLTDPVDPTFVADFQKSTLAQSVPDGLLETVVAESLKVPARVWRSTFAEFLEADFSDQLHRIQAPTLIAWGEQDALFPRSDQDLLRAAIFDSRLLVYPTGGHAFHWEDPARYASDLRAFVQRLGVSERMSA